MQYRRHCSTVVWVLRSWASTTVPQREYITMMKKGLFRPLRSAQIKHFLEKCLHTCNIVSTVVWVLKSWQSNRENPPEWASILSQWWKKIVLFPEICWNEAFNRNNILLLEIVVYLALIWLMLLFVWFCLFVCVLCSWHSTTKLIRVSCCSLACLKRNSSKMNKMLVAYV